MQSSLKSDIVMHSFDILLFDQFSNHCLANTVEPMRAANTLAQRKLYTWQILSTDGQSVTSSAGMRVTPDNDLADGSNGTLIVMPSYGFQGLGDWQLYKRLRAAAKKYQRLAGFDTGSWLLAQARLLDGYQATIHWEEFTAFAEAFPNVDAVQDRYVLDRDRVTCSGAMAAFDLILQLIADQHGALLAMDVAQLFLARGEDTQLPRPTGAPGRLVRQTMTLMQQHIETPLKVRDLAQRLSVTQRALETRVRLDLKATPQTLYRRLRLNHARKLVQETDLTIAEISGRAGYENASAMTRAFKTEFGITPRTLRNI